MDGKIPIIASSPFPMLQILAYARDDAPPSSNAPNSLFGHVPIGL
jgi:hypothetical protein